MREDGCHSEQGPPRLADRRECKRLGCVCPQAIFTLARHRDDLGGVVEQKFEQVDRQ